MTISTTANPLVYLTVHEFSESFFPYLISKLKNEVGLTLRDASKTGERIIKKLKTKFKANKPQPVKVFQKAITTIVVRETNKLKRLMDKNFGLSEDSFNDLVLQLQLGNEQLYEKVFLSHFDSCLSFLKKKFNASHEDAYDASMDAMLAFCRKLKAGDIQYGNIRFLFTQMAGHIYLKWVKRESKTEDFSNLDLADELPPFDKESFEMLEKAFAMLGDGCNKLLSAFYYNENTLNHIAEKIGKSHAATRKQKQRCIEKLRAYFVGLS